MIVVRLCCLRMNFPIINRNYTTQASDLHSKSDFQNYKVPLMVLNKTSYYRGENFQVQGDYDPLLISCSCVCVLQRMGLEWEPVLFWGSGKRGQV